MGHRRQEATSHESAAEVIVDLCTGSGALALALATEIPGSTVHAVEVDPGAVRWARINLDRSASRVADAGSTVSIVGADATTVTEPGGPLADLQGLVDVVVTNPPYVPDDAIPRDPEVRDHDPALALFGGPDGLDVVRRLVARPLACSVRVGWSSSSTPTSRATMRAPPASPGCCAACPTGPT